MVRIPFGEFGVMLVVLLGLAFKGLASLVIVYLGTRLAIRHERRISN
jgi:hypothetical protein